jgi:hypothetical protein
MIHTAYLNLTADLKPHDQYHTMVCQRSILLAPHLTTFNTVNHPVLPLRAVYILAMIVIFYSLK